MAHGPAQHGLVGRGTRLARDVAHLQTIIVDSEGVSGQVVLTGNK